MLTEGSKLGLVKGSAIIAGSWEGFVEGTTLTDDYRLEVLHVDCGVLALGTWYLSRIR